MPAAAIDLTTIAKVREMLQDDNADQYDDALLQTAITAASRAILNYTCREFAPKTSVAEDRDVLYHGGGVIDLAPYDLRGAPETVTLEASSGPIVLEPSDYLARPIPSPFGVSEWLGLRQPANFDRGCVWPLVVTVRGQWGFPVIPEDVVQWCGITVVIWLRDDISAFSTTFMVEEGRLKRPEDLPSAVTTGLNHYRRRSLA